MILNLSFHLPSVLGAELGEELQAKDAEVFHNVDGTRLAVDPRFQATGPRGHGMKSLQTGMYWGYSQYLFMSFHHSLMISLDLPGSSCPYGGELRDRKWQRSLALSTTTFLMLVLSKVFLMATLL